MSRRLASFLCATVVVGAILSHAAVHAVVEPAWVHRSELPIKWYRPTLTDVVLVATERDLAGVSADSGSVVWRLDGLYQPRAGDVQFLPGLSLALVSVRHGGEKGPLSCSLTDLRTGRSLWTADSLGVVINFGAFLLPGGRLFFYGGAAPKGEPCTLFLLDLTTGRPVWSDPGFERAYRPHLLWRWGSRTLLGHQPPLLDTDSTAILFMTRDAIRKIDLRDGSVIWERRGDLAPRNSMTGTGHFEDQPAPAPEIGYARMIFSADGTRFYAPYQNTVGAFAVGDGAPLWKRPPWLPGQVTWLEEVPGGILVRLEEKPETGDLQYRLALVDAASGKLRWMRPGGSGFLGQTFSIGWDVASAPIPDGPRAVVASDGKLRGIDLAKGNERAIADLHFEGPRGTLALERASSGFRVIGPQDVAVFDASGARTAHLHRDPPDDINRGLALLGISALTGLMMPARIGGGTVDLSLSPSSGLDALLRDYSASREASDHLFMLTTIDDAGGGPGLVRIRRTDLQITDEVMLRTKEPDYQVDEAGRLFLRPDERTLRGYRFEPPEGR